MAKTALMPLEEALDRLLSQAEVLPAETVALDAALGRVLAAPVVARRTTPGRDVSAMDGYAVRAADATQGAMLEVAGESAAGRPYSGTLAPGQAVRLFTGAVVPDGADAVVIQEDTAREGSAVRINEAAIAGRHIRKAGGDFRDGETVLEAGHRLRARDLALVAACDLAAVSVYRRPRVGLLSTGDELVRPGLGAEAHQVILSNIYAVGGVARLAGAEVVDLGILPDRMDDTRAGIRAARDAGLDVLVTSGGASVGDHDLVAPALTAEGATLAVHKIALRPGKPLMFGRFPAPGSAHVLGLPGNPVSAYVCALIFLRPLLRRLQGEAGVSGLELVPAELAVDVKANDHRMDFMRAEITGHRAGIPQVRPMPVQDSSMLSLLSRADALLVRGPNAPAARAGETCEILPLED
ncbi:molybdopterin molybdotransferase MoeA [Ancylobacter sp. Lp-2]|uniref:molybdopterin molybdotransferase MoeA n=1 Tax=Ancylobacter sp. Lp-2 TaxID=2881339 RepID=UPI001E61568E|nr:gephyrin-like molybdotransferase Glp [Ancylobacter sp. Lp-2]MCB4771540.1 molybdopterin molybdotransferase MoeA [Ancylobacter sp. Lp-2]